jgi:hypothetical protein
VDDEGELDAAHGLECNGPLSWLLEDLRLGRS